MTSSTSTETIKWDKATHGYKSRDGRFTIERPETGRMTDGWYIEDATRFDYHFSSSRLVVEPIYAAQIGTLKECKAIAERWAADGGRGYASYAEARAAGRERRSHYNV